MRKETAKDEFKAAMMKNAFIVGDYVEFPDNNGTNIIGRVVKNNRVNIIVFCEESNETWRVRKEAAKLKWFTESEEAKMKTIGDNLLNELREICKKRTKLSKQLDRINDNVVRINFLIDAEIIRKKEKKVLEYALNFQFKNHEKTIAIINWHLERINDELETIRELLPLPEFDTEFGTEKFPGA